jgi:CelD/BcsL family acetyltransferase involved in cellulose biosynthesis
VDISPLSVRSLTPELVEAWIALQQSNLELASPCFSPQFAMGLAEFVDDVRVGILRKEGKVAGFFPFRRGPYGMGKPLDMCDYDGVICAPGLEWSPEQLLRACGLRSWDFGHLLASQTPFAKFHRASTESPIIDLSHGYEAYVRENRAGGSEQIKKAGNLERRLEREVGPLRFEAQNTSPAILGQLMQWADEKRQRMRSEDDWTIKFLERLLGTSTDMFSGMLSVLYAGEQMVAAHFGMRSRHVWHYWLPAYSATFEKYSPGIILLLKMAQSAEALGLRVIDLGKGTQPYKQRLMNRAIPLAEGFVEIPSIISTARAVKRKSEALFGQSPALLALVRRVFGAAARARRLRVSAK